VGEGGGDAGKAERRVEEEIQLSTHSNSFILIPAICQDFNELD
jgi:hypothetical protein